MKIWYQLILIYIVGSNVLAQTIPYPKNIKLKGAVSNVGTTDYTPSPYYKHPDFYHIGNTSSRTILPHFKTYQQTTEYTCGPAALLMVAYYYGVRLNELKISKIIGTNEKNGTSTKQMVKYLNRTGWKVRSSLTEPNIATLQFLKNQIKIGHPIMVEWVDWAGHWQVVIGYDDMGTNSNVSDDVLIMADPYDTTDHLQDGYIIVPAERFQYMWFDHNLQPKNQRKKQWILFYH